MKTLKSHAALGLALMSTASAYAQDDSQILVLEELIVTSQKRMQTEQEIPLAVSVMGEKQLFQEGVRALTDLSSGSIPALKISPFPNSPTTLVIFVRGVGNADSEQVSKESGVGLYLDNVYLGRAQGLGMDLADLERVEILRGPQGTTFGRNTVGGAINMTSKPPEGRLSIKQSFSASDFDLRESVTHINLPKIAELSAKVSYIKSSKDGWVENRDSSQSDYAELDKEGARISLQWEPTADWLSTYNYDHSKVESTQLYYQIYFSNLGLESEPARINDTRIPVTPFKPSKDNVDAHTLTVEWNANDYLLIKSISAVRELDVALNANYGGSFSYGGLVLDGETEQRQISQEFQFIGANDESSLEYIAGLYWFDENADDVLVNFGSLISGFEGQLITLQPTRIAEVSSKSFAAFGQLTWTPMMAKLEDRLHVTFGGRYTDDDKRGKRPSTVDDHVDRFQFDTQRFDPMLTVAWDLAPTMTTYLSWSQAYRAGGANLRSATFRSYDEEELQSIEWGFKSDLLDQRLRANIAVFHSDYDDKQIDFFGADISIAETINATEGLVIEGAELDLRAVLFAGMQLNLQYVYLDYDLPDQFNPLTNTLERFELPQTPRHSGSLSLDYSSKRYSFGTLNTSLSINSSAEYYFGPKNFQRLGRYDLLNARITLADIPVGDESGNLKVSLWGRNLTDQEWVIHSVDSTLIGGADLRTVSQAFGHPRTYGVTVIYEFSE